eukprot:NODE_1701_length_1636_cov_118.806345_g1621_i0.p1 GENE.NODE_1701_length_1636_cov_118.806345_g1621_i0~~NODE_1701_length_1636_cov_118.806345_g1621_i0.p1  ORF type:complete len:502 (-),score=49.10 NODE_1701_length_1636_cov_118.806345_g1621_i0:131-1567(-)
MAQKVTARGNFYQYHKGDYRDVLLDRLQALEPYQKPFWYSPHLVSVIEKVHPQPTVSLEREILQASDGMFSVDWAHPEHSKEKHHLRWTANSETELRPVLIVMPGLGGGEGARSITLMCQAAVNVGWRAVILRYRGWSEKITTPKVFNGLDPSDLIFLMKTIQDRYPGCKMVAVGTSAGSNLLVNYLGKAGDSTPLAAAMSICNGFELQGPLKRLEESGVLGKIYSWGLAKKMGQIVEANKSVLKTKEGLDIKEALEAKSLSEYNAKVATSLYEYEDAAEFYRHAECKSWLCKVRRPTLFLQPLDDPLFCGKVQETIPYDELAANPHLMYMETPHGGHLGWVEGGWTRNEEGYVDRLLKPFLEWINEFCPNPVSPEHPASLSTPTDIVLNMEPALKTPEVKLQLTPEAPTSAAPSPEEPSEQEDEEEVRDLAEMMVARTVDADSREHRLEIVRKTEAEGGSAPTSPKANVRYARFAVH